MIRLGVLLAGCAALLLSSCSPVGQKKPRLGRKSGEPPWILTVNYPLTYFAERIGGKHVDVRFPAPPDVDPAFWKPDAKAIAEYQAADLILLNGADYARWVATASLPASRLVDSSAAVKKDYIKVKDAVVHQHGPEGKHSHEGIAFTTWLDPEMAIAQARAIKEAFVKLDPGHSLEFEKNFSALSKDLLGLDDEAGNLVLNKDKKPLVASHPVYQYLARRYGLDLRSVHWEPDEYPDDKAWTELAELLKKHPAKAMLWEGKPLDKTVARLEKMGVKSYVFSPVANRPADGDYLSVMRRNIESLRQALSN